MEWQALHSLAHAIKGSSATIAASDLSNAALQLEKAAKCQDVYLTSDRLI